MVKKSISTDNLAVMIKKGFDDITERMATKEDLRRFATKEDLQKTSSDLERKIDRLEVGLSKIEDKLIPKLDFEDLEGRVGYVESKLGIQSGK